MLLEDTAGILGGIELARAEIRHCETCQYQGQCDSNKPCYYELLSQELEEEYKLVTAD